jgi:hypothetical protein
MTGLENRVTYYALGFFMGMVFAFGWGHFIDRDRDVVINDYYQFVEGDKFDLNAHGPVYQTTPPVVRPDPGGKGGGKEGGKDHFHLGGSALDSQPYQPVRRGTSRDKGGREGREGRDGGGKGGGGYRTAREMATQA